MSQAGEEYFETEVQEVAENTKIGVEHGISSEGCSEWTVVTCIFPEECVVELALLPEEKPVSMKNDCPQTCEFLLGTLADWDEIDEKTYGFLKECFLQ
jgi:hypothetical protein